MSDVNDEAIRIRGGTRITRPGIVVLPNRLIMGRPRTFPDYCETWLRGDTTWALFNTHTVRTSTANGIVGFPTGEIIQFCNATPFFYVDGIWTAHADFGVVTRLVRTGGFSDTTWGIYGTGWVKYSGGVGGSWSYGATDQATAIWGVDANEAWLIGGAISTERMYHTTNGGANWTNLYSQWVTDTGGSGYPTGVFGFGASSVFFAHQAAGGGSWGFLSYWNGSNFVLVGSFGYSPGHVWGVDANNVYTAGSNVPWGQNLTVMKWNGVSTSRIAQAPTLMFGNMDGIWGTADGQVIIASQGGGGYQTVDGGANWAEGPAGWPSVSDPRISDVGHA